MQSNILTIDRGNSHVKMRLYSEGECILSRRNFHISLDDIAILIAKHSLTGMIYTSVASDFEADVEILKRVGVRLIILNTDIPLPIGIEYGSRATLGSDRIAAVVGALSLYPSERLLVADAGTALTLDAADPDRGFIGGNISPGIRMRLQALHNYTARLPEVSSDGPTPLIGHDTITALRCGAVRGAAAETAIAASTINASQIVITGGDGELLEKYLKEITDIPATVVSDLVEIGLLRIYEYNENNL